MPAAHQSGAPHQWRDDLRRLPQATSSQPPQQHASLAWIPTQAEVMRNYSYTQLLKR